MSERNLFTNPILSGCYPDPSICRVGDDYYMVTSSFEYFPGVPIFHSKDLVNWRQLGHVLDRPSQLNLDVTPSSKGIYAATIRYRQGVFYMITTFVESALGARRNFYVTAENPAGPWSDPIWLHDAPGIDSSFFFDDDGKAYVMANRKPPGGQQYPKHMEIWLQEIDLEQGALIGERMSLWDGAMKDIHAQEGPHIYKVGGYYYILIAEGGTGHTHAVTAARSQNIAGPYENCKSNPILTHRHLGRSASIVNVGHADLVETQTGEWWMVCLGSRPYGGYYRNLGRETFLVRVEWEDGWPVVNPGKGIVELESNRPNLPEHRFPLRQQVDGFDEETLDHCWNLLRSPRGDFWSLKDRPGWLRLRLKPEKLSEFRNPSFLGRRQQHMSFAVNTVMEFTPESDGEAAGIALYMSHEYHYRFEYAMDLSQTQIRLVACKGGEEQTIQSHPVHANRLHLRIGAEGQHLRFDYRDGARGWQTLADGVDGTILSPDVASGFLGAYIGLFATSNGKVSENAADFDWFEYDGRLE